ncbi:hypothetical protein AB3327_16025 (plasmid) [Lactiplantibacillus pentosus]|uniref:hypothetical protein n=1 Tax=Lactobacillaceae TaxID=33958 RepID=UPI00079FFFBB|nr:MULTISPECIES: hypothetical protein [Lactobacillaceae]MCB5223355.1 hypothetical protein [Lactiplantibacillus pentosus]
MQRLIKIRRSSKQATVGDVRQGLRLLAVLLIGVPLLFAVYLWLKAQQQGEGVFTLLNAQPYLTIMGLVACLDIISGSLLLQFGDSISTNKSLFSVSVGLLIITHLLLSNLLIAGVGAVLWWQQRRSAGTRVKINAGALLIISSLTTLYGLSLLGILRLLLG